MGQRRKVAPPSALDNIGIVLDRTRHASNIGAVCRVMKNLGYQRLHLVNPTEFGHLAAVRMTQGAEDLLESAAIHATVPEAIGQYQIAFATSRRMKQDESHGIAEAARRIASLARENKVAVVFGSEKFGLAREDVDRCGEVISIPVDPAFASVNLAQSVAMICMAVRMQLDEEPHHAQPPKVNLPVEERNRFYDAFYALFGELGMGGPAVAERLKSIFDRANLTAREQNLFYGLIKEVRKLKK